MVFAIVLFCFSSTLLLGGIGCDASAVACDSQVSLWALAVAAFATTIRSFGQQDPFSPRGVFPVAYYAFYLAPSLNWADFWPILPNAGPGLTSLVLLGGVAYEAGLLAGTVVFQAHSVPRLSEESVNQLTAPGAVTVALVIALTCAAFAAWALLSAGTIPILSDDPEMARIEFSQDAGGFRTLATRLPMVGALLTTAVGVAAVRSGRRLVTTVMLVSFTVQLGLLLLLAMRGVLVMVVATVLFIWSYSIRPIGWPRVLGASLSAVLLLGFAAFLRLNASESEALEVLASSSQLPEWAPAWLLFPYVTVSYGGFVFSKILSTIPGEVAFQGGSALLNGALGVLPGPQKTLGAFVTQDIMGFDERNPFQLPPTLLGGFYVDFGVWGVFFGMVFFALVSVWLYHRSRQGSTIGVFLYSYWVMHAGVTLYSDLVPNSFAWMLPMMVTAGLITARLAGAPARSGAMER